MTQKITVLLEARFSPDFAALYAVVDNEDNSYGAVKIQTDYSFADNWPKLAKFTHLVTYAEAIVTYLRTIVDDQSAKWASR